jgi:hypothetical protein
MKGGEPMRCHLVVTTAVGVQAVGEVGCGDRRGSEFCSQPTMVASNWSIREPE